MKQTAMQLAIQHYEQLSLKGSNLAYVVAKFLKENYLEMEKQQIIDAFENGEDNIDSDGCSIDRNGAEQYYNETFNN
jgi:hypothetical protein